MTDEETLQSMEMLRALARNSPRSRPGCIHIGPMVVHYNDAASLYVQFKDIFHQRIYHFESPCLAPRIIDGGACTGMATLYYKSVYPKARVLCFEPDPSTFKLLERNIRENALSDVELICAGLAEHEASVGFVPDGADGGRIAEGASGRSTVRTVRLSCYLESFTDFVKLNIEGHEFPVLCEIAENDGLDHVNELVLEYHGWPGHRQRLGAILDLLDRCGFRYLIHDFDSETCKASKPPFKVGEDTRWYCLVYARRLPLLCRNTTAATASGVQVNAPC